MSVGDGAEVIDFEGFKHLTSSFLFVLGILREWQSWPLQFCLEPEVYLSEIDRHTMHVGFLRLFRLVPSHPPIRGRLGLPFAGTGRQWLMFNPSLHPSADGVTSTLYVVT